MIRDFILQFTSNQYLIALGILAFYFAIIRVGVFVVEKIFLRFASKTKTDLDDLIISKTNKPFSFLVLIIGIKIALEEIAMIDKTQSALHLILTSLIILISAYIIYTIFDLSFSRVWRRLARKTKTKPNDALVQLVQGTIKVVLVVAVLLSLLHSWGIEVGPFLAGLGIGGIAIAFALQSSLANIFGGISIILDKTIRVGDVVSLADGVSGTIKHIGLRSTRVETFDNEVIVVPNSKLSNENVHNIAQPEPKVRVIVPFGVAYGSDVDKVKNLVLKEIKKVGGFVNVPEPSVRFLEMGASSLNFKAYFFVDSFENRLAALDEANTRIYNALNKAGFEIPFPQMDVHIKK